MHALPDFLLSGLALSTSAFAAISSAECTFRSTTSIQGSGSIHVDITDAGSVYPLAGRVRISFSGTWHRASGDDSFSVDGEEETHSFSDKMLNAPFLSREERMGVRVWVLADRRGKIKSVEAVMPFGREHTACVVDGKPIPFRRIPDETPPPAPPTRPRRALYECYAYSGGAFLHRGVGPTLAEAEQNARLACSLGGMGCQSRSCEPIWE